ncbi:MAG: hypothetical protein WAX77_00225 [Methylococcaceae bacterium]
MLVRKTAVSMASLLLGFNLQFVQAAPILDAPVPPDHYHCQGKGADVLLYTDALATTTLKLKLNGVVHQVQNDGITTESSLLGDIKEITIGFRPDVSITYASVIIPSILLGADVPQISFKTQLAVTTVIHSMIMSAPQGISNNSSYIDLICKAKRLNP